MTIDLKGRHMVTLYDWSAEEIRQLLHLADRLKQEVYTGISHPLLAGKTLAMIFEKPSLRTMVSFQTGMYQLGGHAIYLGPDQIGLGKRESVEDVARVLSSYVDGIMARTFSYEAVKELARYSSVPVINGLTDFNHPCQVLADLLTIYESRSHMKGLSMVYIGDGNNMAHSLAIGCAKMGMHFTCACPEGYDPKPEAMDMAREVGRKTGSRIEVSHDVMKAAEGADVLYTDVWASMGQEKEKEERKSVFKGYQINMDVLNRTAPDSMVLHCLPAHYNEEITKDVVDDPRSYVFKQAENRLHAQKALMLATMA